jgi:hypothetical protein
MLNFNSTNHSMFFAGTIALLYGLWMRVTFQSPWEDIWDLALGTITLGFCFAVPVAIGALTVFLSPQKYKIEWWYGLLAPWAPCLVLGGVVTLLQWEVFICVIMALPIFMTMASVGGLIVTLLARNRQKSATQNTMLGLIIILPYLIAPLEQQLPPPTSIRPVETQIEIAADSATVWQNVATVPKISEAEHHFSLFHWLGLPRPVEATLSHWGVGGIRAASFEEGLSFKETIYQWDEQKSIRFTIEVQLAASPLRSPLEQIGGQYLDVFDGGFWLEPIGPDRVILHLSSQHRLSTNFNFYGGLWTDWVMRDLQNYILSVIKARCEARP